MNWLSNRLTGLILVAFATLVVRAAPDFTDKPVTLDPPTRALLTEVQRAGVRYFYEFGHPVSGLTRVGTERAAELCEIGGTGWGCFNLIVAAERGFVPRADVAARVQTLLRFLSTKADGFTARFPIG